MPPWICRIPSLERNHFLHKFPIFAHISLVSFSTLSSNISIIDYLVNHHNFSPECAAKVSSSLSSKYLNKPQNAGPVLNFLKEIGFPKNQIEAVIQKVPRLLSADLESIKPKVKVFHEELGIHSTDLANLISRCPWLLNSSADRLRLSMLGLKNVLGSNTDICKFGKYLMYDLNRTLLPNMEYLKTCGICPLQIASQVCGSPMVFFAKPERFKGIVKRVDEMGIHRQSKAFLYAVRAMGSMTRESWELKLKLFRDLGFSEQNISHAFGVTPRAFSESERKIREVTQLLLSVEGFVISHIISSPLLLCFSVEKRLKP